MSSKPQPIDASLTDALTLFADRGTEKGLSKDVPAKVITYDRPTQTADLQPLIMVSKNGRLRAMPIARQVQVRWPAGSGWSIVGDLVKGDFGWIVPAAGDISAWKMQGTEVDPTAIPRKGKMSDVRFEPGSQPVSTPLASDAYKAGALVIRAAELLLGDSAAVKALALHLDAVNKDASAPALDFASWMTSVEAVAQAGGGVVAPLASAITKIGAVQATATKVKAI